MRRSPGEACARASAFLVDPGVGARRHTNPAAADGKPRGIRRPWAMQVAGEASPPTASNPHPTRPLKEHPMSLGTILLIVLILMLFGALPTWPHSSKWGYGPSGGLGLVVVVIVVLLLMGRL
jgi:Protein of unknown function (DUF3309)